MSRYESIVEDATKKLPERNSVNAPDGGAA